MSPSWQARLATWLVRRRVRPALAAARDIAQVRRVFEPRLPVPGGVRYRPATLGGVSGEWVEPRDASPADTLLYLHGGAFVACSPRTHRPVTAAFARHGFRVFVPDDRLAPEHPFPAAPDDALAVWRTLRAGLAGGRLVVAGESAGGNLALGLLHALKDVGEPLPDACAVFSPATDLTRGSASHVVNRDRDAMFSGDEVPELVARAYLGAADPAQPRASPLLGDFTGMPPLLIHVADEEILRDDALRLAARAQAAGVRVELEVYPGVPHGWQLLHRLPEARRSVADAARFLREAQAEAGDEQLDVLIVGAGLSGVGAAVHLRHAHPGMSFALFESRAAIGGTWDLFRYPGVRSDSDMYTLGYRFKPWLAAQAIADGPAIRGYIAQTADEHGIRPFVRHGHRVLAADWREAEGRWHVQVQCDTQATPRTVRARFVFFCGGYYAYDRGHRPQWPGESDFLGRIVHPQFWPADLDYAGKRVAVIGSGATAVTLVPEMARTAARVTMLQRSPSYVFARPSVDAIAEVFKRWLPPMLAYRLVRLKNVAMQQYFYRMARRHPDAARRRLVGMVRAQLPAGFDVARHFTPPYKPWDQRICLVPDADLFAAIRDGRADVVTDTIERFTASGIRLASGAEVPADVIVTATGLELTVLGGMRLSLDGRPVDPATLTVYKGMMYGGIPNLITTFGYTNASWTLKADLTAAYACRLLGHLQRHGGRSFVPRVDPSVRHEPFLDFTSGYVQRALSMLPRQGDRAPWKLHQNYTLDLLALRFAKVDDGVMQFR
jgi:cation diffusion facilitator CzcD-associated flavoprotein CzcO/acetyl esterase/lipase